MFVALLPPKGPVILLPSHNLKKNSQAVPAQGVGAVEAQQMLSQKCTCPHKLRSRLLQNHRTFWVVKDLTEHLVPTPLPWAGHLPPHQVAQSPVRPGLEHFQTWGSHSFSGQPVPVPHHPHSKEFLPYI